MVRFPHRRIAAPVAVAVALALVTQAVGQAVLPQVALERPAEYALVVDLEAATPERMAATRQVLERAAGEEVAAGLEHGLSDYDELWQAIHDTGLRQVVVLGSPDGDAVTVLLAHAAGTDVEDLAAGLLPVAQMGLGGPVGHGEIEITAIDDRWAYVSGPNLIAPGSGEAADHGALDAILAEAQGAAVRLAFTPGDASQQMLAQAQQDPNAMMFAGAMGPLQGLTSGIVSLQLGEAAHVELSLEFADADAARHFHRELNQVVQAIGAIAAMGMAQDPDAPEVDFEAMQRGLASLVPELNDTRVSKRFDEALLAGLADAGLIEVAQAMQGPDEEMDDFDW